MIKAVLFDYDGVLSVTSNKSSLSDAIAHFYGERIGWDKLGDLHTDLSKGKITTNDFFRRLAERHHSAKVLTEQEWDTVFGDIFTRAEPVYELAAKLRRAGIKTGILSNMYAMTAAKLRAQGNFDGFDPIVVSYEVGFIKPESEIYQAALQTLKLDAREVLFVDDREASLAPAKELGMQTLLASSPEQIVEDLSQLIAQENSIKL